MKWVYGGWLVLFLAVRLAAQPNVPVKLALITESAAAQPAADLLTASFSTNAQIQLLERDQIEKVYHEQALAAGNTDYLKLGRLLGADGLLLLEVVATPQATNLNTRLIAVKPGVILNSGSYGWPLPEITQWADLVAQRVDGFLPKLTVLPKEAIPLSVVNLRSAISSAAGAETEKELKLLTIQRLSAERQLFVTEREKLQAAAEERGLAGDETAFWNGSYLLEGVIDQNGYSAETLTINAQLTPPKGGVPVALAVSGSRTNLAAVVNALALKVVAALSVQPTAVDWSPADEAAQYFAEAQWALKWGAYAEAQAAADSAWALGKGDLESISLRIETHLQELQQSLDARQSGCGTSDQPGFMPILDEDAFRRYQDGTDTSAGFPGGRDVNQALHILNLYYEFNLASPETVPKPAWHGQDLSGRRGFEWYTLGVRSMEASARVLQEFYFVPQAQRPVTGKLEKLRALLRSISALINTVPAIHDSYFVGDRIATGDELVNFMEPYTNIFLTEVKWGCFWLETPEDDLALYRKLMESPVFCYIHSALWLRKPGLPRLVAWQTKDRQRIPALWEAFLDKLGRSTNILLQLETKALVMADAKSDVSIGQAYTNLFNCIFENRDALVGNNVDVMRYDWALHELITAKTFHDGEGNRAFRNALQHQYYLEYSPKLYQMGREYWEKTVPARKLLAVFEKQKQFLQQQDPFEYAAYEKLFGNSDYSPTQAREILPLVTAYKATQSSRLLTATNGFNKGKLQMGVFEAGYLESRLNEILNPVPPPLRPVPVGPKNVAASQTSNLAIPVATPLSKPENITNIITISHFLALPITELPGIQNAHFQITAHHWSEGKLVLDLSYESAGETSLVTATAIAILDPANEHWELVPCPPVPLSVITPFYHHTQLFHGDLFTIFDGRIRKYDFKNHRWLDSEISHGVNCQLYVANDRLYAVGAGMISEVIPEVNATRILASNRRQPPVSRLDSQNLAHAIPFGGPDHSLRVSTGGNIFTWTNGDWREDATAPITMRPPQIFPEGVLFYRTVDSTHRVESITQLRTDNSKPEPLLSQKLPVRKKIIGFNGDPERAPATFWTAQPEFSLSQLSGALHGQYLYLLADHSVVHINHINPGRITGKVDPRDGYHTVLLRYCPRQALPQKYYLKFEGGNVYPPAIGLDTEINQEDYIRPLGDEERLPVWFLIANDTVLFGMEQTWIGLPNAIDSLGYVPGIWMIPLSKLETGATNQPSDTTP